MTGVTARVIERSARVERIDLSALPDVAHQVYFARIGSDGPIKIGVSLNPAIRLKQLQRRGEPRVTLLGTIRGGFDVERALHLRFAHLRLHGEWFGPADDLLAYIAGRAQKAS